MELKVGDKIRIIKNKHDFIRGTIGTIVEVRPPQRSYHYLIFIHPASSKKGFYYPVKDGSIEKVSRKGEQLLLFEL